MTQTIGIKVEIEKRVAVITLPDGERWRKEIPEGITEEDFVITLSETFRNALGRVKRTQIFKTNGGAAMSDWQPGFYQRTHGPFPPPIGGLQNSCRIEFKECEPGDAVRAKYVSLGCETNARFFEVRDLESDPEGDLIAICEHEILTD